MKRHYQMRHAIYDKLTGRERCKRMEKLVKIKQYSEAIVFYVKT